MQGLVHLLIVLAGAALGVLAYFAPLFVPVPAVLAALAALLFILAAHAALWNRRRLRAERRFEKAIEEFSRLLSTDAQAGQMLNQRLNALVEIEPGRRLETLEADVSVLGTVVRQVAEAVSELEAARPVPAAQPEKPAAPPLAPPAATPRLPVSELAAALDEERLVLHARPVLTLPQRRPHLSLLVPRLRATEGGWIEVHSFLPPETGEGAALLRRLDRLEAALALDATAGRAEGEPPLVLRLSAATLTAPAAADALQALFEERPAQAATLLLALPERDWTALSPAEAGRLDRLLAPTAGLMLRAMSGLRLDLGAAAARRVRYMGVDAAGFLADPARFTDFHPADLPDYLGRFGIRMLVTGVETEAQILALLDDGIGLGEGPGLASPLPLRAASLAAPRRARF